MKTIISLRVAVMATILLAAFTSATKLSAQLNCGYTIVNNLLCPVTISYKAEDCANMPTCSIYGATIAANGGVLFLPASCCASSCDIYINVLTIGGTPVTQVPGAVYSGSTAGGGTTTSACGNTPPNWFINWTNSTTIIN